MLADFAQRGGAAILVGQRSGGNRRGLNGGELARVTLPNSGVAFDIPLLTTNNLTPQPDESVTSDIVVARTYAARASGRDEEMEAVWQAIARSN